MRHTPLVFGLALIVISVACGNLASRNAVQSPVVSQPTVSDAERDSSSAPLLDGVRRSQVTTRQFQAIESGSEFLQTDSVLVTVRPRDTIPAILDPIFAGREEAGAWMEDDELVLGLEIGDDARAYPINIFSWHEIVNDTVGGTPVAITW